MSAEMMVLVVRCVLAGEPAAAAVLSGRPERQQLTVRLALPAGLAP